MIGTGLASVLPNPTGAVGPTLNGASYALVAVWAVALFVALVYLPLALFRMRAGAKGNYAATYEEGRKRAIAAGIGAVVLLAGGAVLWAVLTAF